MRKTEGDLRAEIEDLKAALKGATQSLSRCDEVNRDVERHRNLLRVEIERLTNERDFARGDRAQIPGGREGRRVMLSEQELDDLQRKWDLWNAPRPILWTEGRALIDYARELVMRARERDAALTVLVDIDSDVAVRGAACPTCERLGAHQDGCALAKITRGAP